jgi:transcriptional regulator with XRE-family HTH domain
MVGSKIRHVRKQKGMSQNTLSQMAKLQRCQISDLERGKLQLEHVHWGTIQRLCKALNLSPYDFMDESA